MLAAEPRAPLLAPSTADGPLVTRDDRLMMTAASLGHATDVPLRWALGRKHVEQYVGELAPGRWQALPRAFDVVGKQWFDLFAGETRTPAD
jgi:hypothetical protein